MEPTQYERDTRGKQLIYMPGNVDENLLPSFQGLRLDSYKLNIWVPCRFPFTFDDFIKKVHHIELLNSVFV